MLWRLADTLVISYAVAAVYRSLGKTSVTMYISVVSEAAGADLYQLKPEV